MIEIFLLFLLFTKHFVCDFPLQTPYQFLNKGMYGHPGGLLHQLIHIIGTVIVSLILMHGMSVDIYLQNILLAISIEAIIHYHTDWAKVKLNTRFKLTPQTKEFWILLGADQYIHYVTYAIMVIILLHF